MSRAEKHLLAAKHGFLRRTGWKLLYGLWFKQYANRTFLLTLDDAAHAQLECEPSLANANNWSVS